MGLLLVIYIVFISLGLPDSLFGVSWPVVHLEFGIDQSFASVYSIIVGVCSGGVSFVAGKLIRRFGTGKVTFFSTMLTAVGLIGISFAPNVVAMILFAIVLSYGAGAIDTGLNNYVSLHYEARHMSWLHCFWGVGVTLSPMIMSAFLGGGTGAWRGGYRVVALMQAAIALLVLFTLPKWQRNDKLSAADPSQQRDIPEKKLPELLRIPGVLSGILSLGLYCSAESLIGTWGATYAVEIFHLPAERAAWWISLYYGGIMFGRVISGFASAKASDNTLIRCGIVISIVGIAVLFLPIGPGALAGLLLIGAGFGPIFPSIIHSIPARFGLDYSADITGYHMGGAYGIGYVVQLCFGYAASATTFAVTPCVLLLLCVGVWVANRATVRLLRNARA